MWVFGNWFIIGYGEIGEEEFGREIEKEFGGIRGWLMVCETEFEDWCG